MKPLIAYYGGKQRLASWIIQHFPPHLAYIEPFCGGAAVFFAKELAALNVLNDLDGNVVNLYRMAKLRPESLFRLINATPHSRAEYDRAAAIYKGRIEATDLERAWATYTACHQAFAKKIAMGWAFQKGKFEGYNRDVSRSYTTVTWRKAKARFFDQVAKLDHAQIDCIDAIKCIKRYDSQYALFYVDPPYVDTQQGHYGGYTQSDFDALLAALTQVKGKFFLSHYAQPALEAFANKHGWAIHRKETRMSAAKNRADVDTKRVELLITNHLPATLFNH